MPGIGSVGYDYYIGTYEVTNSQYVSFLNATAASDTHGLWNINMGFDPDSFRYGGISRTGSSGSYSYAVIPGRGNLPVNEVSFWDAARFANWLTTGDTETGVYVLDATGIANNTIARDMTAWANGGVAIASENEWYKAAYYSGSPTGADGDGYWLFPTQSNSFTTAMSNVDSAVGDLTAVGTYVGNPSYYGTFDQGGNVLEWNDDILSVFSGARVQRGGSFRSSAGINSDDINGSIPIDEANYYGFRVSSLNPIAIPEPSHFGGLMGALALLMAWRVKGRRM